MDYVWSAGANKVQKNNPTVDHFQATECEVDMLFDIDKGKLDIGVVGKSDDQYTIKIWGLPQQNNGWVPKKAIEYISDYLNVPEIKVLEIATFYSMYNLSPVGKYHIEICTTTPCMLRGSDKILEECKKK